jgi:protein-S-isoprenylcysteine O-methyltransferase Ste14
MKERIKVDTALVSVAIILTGVIYQFPHLYPSSRAVDNVLDFIGLIVMLKGAYIRMAARGVKKAHSRQGAGLVKVGLYSFVRNPMYLGSFLMGAGFVLIVWPVWFLPVYAVLFYLRFKRQIVKEEKFLSKHFGKEYEDYCRKVPRLFPRPTLALWRVRVREAFPWKETWSTKDARGIVVWPLAAAAFESLQEWRVYGSTDLRATLLIFCAAAVFFAAVLAYRYQAEA